MVLRLILSKGTALMPSLGGQMPVQVGEVLEPESEKVMEELKKVVEKELTR